MSGVRAIPWRPIPGSGQSLAVGSGASSTFTNKMGLNLNYQTHALVLSLAPTATATGCLIKVSQTGTAATAVLDLLVKTTDPPLIISCATGDEISAYGLAACTLYLTEVTW